MELDLLIKGGEVIDGTGPPRYEADLGITGKRISLLGSSEGAVARRVISTPGLVVCRECGITNIRDRIGCQMGWRVKIVFGAKSWPALVSLLTRGALRP